MPSNKFANFLSEGCGRYQRGYLYEIPLILLAIFLTLALMLPRLSVVGRKVLSGVAIIPMMCCLFYVIVHPGWTITAGQRGRSYGRLALFLACAAATILMAAAFILR